MENIFRNPPRNTCRRIIISMQVSLWWDPFSTEFLADRRQKNPFLPWKSSLTSKSSRKKGKSPGIFLVADISTRESFESTSNPQGYARSPDVFPVSFKPNSHSSLYSLWDPYHHREKERQKYYSRVDTEQKYAAT